MSLLLAIALSQTPVANPLTAARAAAAHQSYPQAAEAFAKAAELLPGCTDLEYDTGTAAAQAGQVGLAVLHLERALRESPWDRDARANLETIRQKRIDKVMGQEPGESPVQRLAAGLPGRLLFWWAVLAWWAGFVVLIARRLGRAGLGAAWATVLLVVAGLGFAGTWFWQTERAIHYGVVVVAAGEPGVKEGVKVHSGAAADLPSSFEVHDGLKVLILDAENGFTHIRLGNGLEGYVEDGTVEAI